MARAPWDRPGETPATRRLRIALFFGTIAIAVFAVATLAWGFFAIFGEQLMR